MKKRGLSFPVALLIVFGIIALIIASYFIVPIIQERWDNRESTGLRLINDSEVKIPEPINSGSGEDDGGDLNNNDNNNNQDASNSDRTSIPSCTETDWSSSLSPTTCPDSNNQTKTWSKIGQCSGGVNHNDSEIISCNQNTIICTNFTYGSWNDCTSSGTQSRNMTSSLPNNCVNGTSILSQTCDYVPLCTETDWSSSLSPTTCPSSGEQIKTWNKIGVCENGITHNPSETITCDYSIPTCTSFTYSDWGVCTSSGTQSRNVLTTSPNGCQGGNTITSQECDYVPLCTENDWTSFISPTTCPSNEQQTKSWTKTGSCSGGVNHPSSETITCDYQIPTCTSFTYSDWGVCTSSGTQSRNVLTTSPNGCAGGNPITSQQCDYVPKVVCGDGVCESGENWVNCVIDCEISYCPDSLNKDWEFVFIDTFDNANNALDYGLNNNLNERQLYGDWAGTNWVRKDGKWNPRTPLPEFSQVGNPSYEDKLSFHEEYSAIMLNKLIQSGVDGGYYISAKVDPITNNEEDTQWVSIMLHDSSDNRGYVTQTNFGFLIGSNGQIQTFQNGNSKFSTSEITSAEEYEIELFVKPGLLELYINGQFLSKSLDEPLPADAYLYLGANIIPGSNKISTFEDISVRTSYNLEKHIKNYGYYWTHKDTTYEHNSWSRFEEVIDYTNFNFVHVTWQNLAGLENVLNSDNCEGKSCILNLKFIFNNNDGLRSDWQDKWQATLQIIDPNQEFIKALYIMDEPFWNGAPGTTKVTPEEYGMILSQVKSDVPNIPIAAVFAYPNVNSELYYVEDLDIVGFDRYPPLDYFYRIENYFNELDLVYSNEPKILVPQTFLREGSTNTDIDTAKINWEYYNLALRENDVIGLWNFGLWTHSDPSEVPITLKTQKYIGEAITCKNLLDTELSSLSPWTTIKSWFKNIFN